MYGIASDEMPPVISAGSASSATPQTSSPAVDARTSRAPASSTFQPAWRNAAPRARATAESGTPLGVQRLLHRLGLRRLDIGLLVLVVLALFVVHGLGVHRPVFFQAEDGIRDDLVTGVQTCALPISSARPYPATADHAGEAPRRVRSRM